MKKVALLSIALLIISYCHSQTNGEKHSANKLKFGFCFGGNYSLLTARGSFKYLNENIINKTGLRLGLLMDYNFSNKTFISPKAELSFNNPQLVFPSIDNNSSSFLVMPASIEFMTHFAYRLGKPYFYFGPSIRIPISYQENYETTIKTKTNLGIDLGIGVEKLTTFFTFAPELRYSFGISKINQSPPELYYNSFSLLLNFK